jgi:hypothetical protein
MKTRQVTLLGFVWLAVACAGMAVLLKYSYAPGDVGIGPPKNWPVSSSIPKKSDSPNLVMFIHPKCPCTRATLTELAVLMTHCQNRVSTSVMIVRPSGVDADWANTDLRQSAMSIPGVGGRVDDEDREARLFHATTSGQVVLYDVEGRLLFSGGITTARGHEGDNAGLSDIEKLLHGSAVAQKTTPVYGCSLLNPASDCTTKNYANRDE